MSAAGILPPLPHTRVERRCRQTPWGIKIETWRLVDTRTLPAESARLPFSLLFHETAGTEVGAVPVAANDQADTLEAVVDGDITAETSALDHDSRDSEKS